MISYKKNFKEYISYYNVNTLESRTDKLMGGGEIYPERNISWKITKGGENRINDLSNDLLHLSVYVYRNILLCPMMF